MANVQITQLPNANPLVGNEQVPIVQSGITVKTTTGAIAAASGPLLNADFVLVNYDPLFPNSRYLSTVLPIDYVDNGPGSNIVISLRNSTVTPGSYTNANITVNSKGIITAASSGTGPTGTVSQVNTGLGLTGGPITTTGTISIDPTVTATLTGIQTLTNKTISGANNTLTNIGNSSLTNSSVTYNGVTVALGSSGTITAANPFSLSTGTGLTGGPYDGSSAVTITIDSTVATLSGTQSFTNKTINASLNAVTNIPNASLDNSTITINSTPISLGGTATITATVANPLTIGTGLSGTSFNGSTAVTIAIDSTVATLAGSQTLTNKSISGATNTLTAIPNAALDNSSITINGSPVSLGGSISITASIDTLTIGTGLTGTSYNGTAPITIAIDSTVATLTGIQTLTNKTINGNDNTLSNISNSSLSNSAVTFNGTAVSLGSSGTITAVNPNALTIGTGLTGTSYDGSSAVTITIDSTVATLTDIQTLSNKTLTSPVISSITNTGTITLPTSTTTLVGTNTSDTLTNKSISGATNTLSSIGNSSLTNSSITIGTNTLSLGDTSLTLSGLTTVTLTQDPTAALEAATKQYVDTLVSSGITYHQPVKYEVPSTTGNLVATYNNGVAGVGATLTNAGTQAAFAPDGPTASIGDRILIYSQTNAFENGVYEVSVVGSGSTNWVLTRTTDTDSYGLKDPNSLGNGDAFFVTSGNTGAGETYVCNTVGVITFGTTNITFAQISSAQVYQAGTGLNLTPATTFNISNTGVTAATYGSASAVPVIAVNAQGQITAANNTSIAIAANQITSGTIAVNQGGTGVVTLTGYVYGNGTSPFTSSLTIPTSDLSGTISNLQLANSSITINGSSVSLGGSTTVTANTANSLTFNNSGTGDASGTTFNGSAAHTISYNTLGAPSATGSGASGTWAIDISGNAATATTATSATTATTATTATNIAGGAAESIPYQTGANTTSFIPIGSNNQVLTVVAGVPTWQTPGAGTAVTTFSAGTTGFTPNTATSGAVTLSGTLNVSNGGTGTTSITGIIYGNGTSAFTAATASDVVTLIGTTAVTNATNAVDATNATNTNITDDTTTNATVYPTWVTANTGNLPQKVTSTKLTFNPSTGVLTSTGGISGGSF